MRASTLQTKEGNKLSRKKTGCLVCLQCRFPAGEQTGGLTEDGRVPTVFKWMDFGAKDIFSQKR